MNRGAHTGWSWWTSLLLFGVGFISCAFAQDSNPLNSPDFDPVASSVVQLLAVGPGEGGKNRECSATGFLVNEEGYILTNAHVVEQAQRCLARSPGAKILAKFATPAATTATAVSCDLVGLDDLHDLAVLKTERSLPADSKGKQNISVRLDPSEVAVGTPVVVTGHPAFAWNPARQSGIVSRRGTLAFSKERPEPIEVIVVNLSLQSGNSGSPVYLERGGAIVGVVERRDPMRHSHTVAVPIRYAIDLLNHLGVEWHAAR